MSLSMSIAKSRYIGDPGVVGMRAMRGLTAQQVAAVHAFQNMHPMVRKRMMMGDPGLFSFLGGLAKTVGKVAGLIPGVGTAVSAITDVVGGAFGGSPGQPKPLATSKGVTARTAGRMSLVLPRSGSAIDVSALGPALPGKGRGNLTQSQIGPAGGHAVIGADSQSCSRGFHVIKKGARAGECTKNRKTNVLNPHALRRATRRLVGFSKRARAIEHQIGKLARRAAPAHRAAGRAGHKSGCGCVACRPRR